MNLQFEDFYPQPSGVHQNGSSPLLPVALSRKVAALRYEDTQNRLAQHARSLKREQILDDITAYISRITINSTRIQQAEARDIAARLRASTKELVVNSEKGVVSSAQPFIDEIERANEALGEIIRRF